MHAGDRQMLKEVLDARARTLYGGPGGRRMDRPMPWHPFWSIWLSVSRVLDEPAAATTAAAAGVLTMIAALNRCGICLRSVFKRKMAAFCVVTSLFGWLTVIIVAQCALQIADSTCWALNACFVVALALVLPHSFLGLVITVIVALCAFARRGDSGNMPAEPS